MRDVVSVRDFVAAEDIGGTVDNTAAIKAWIAYAKTLTAPHLVFDYGIYKITDTIMFDLPDGSTIEWYGQITTGVSGKAAVIIGSNTKNVFDIHVIGRGVHVIRTAIDASGGSAGVSLYNLVASDIKVSRAQNFNFGVSCEGDQGNGGFSYNKVHIGYLVDNKYNLFLTARTGG
jgi:hypothetical protein